MIARLLLASPLFASLALLVAADASPRRIATGNFVRLAAGERISAAGVVVTEASAPCSVDGSDNDPEHCRIPAVRIERPGVAAFTLAGVRGTNAQVGIGPLERGRGTGVILVSFTGGAHCCERYDVAVPGSGGWRHAVVARTETTDRGRVRQTEFDYGLKAFPTDVDGDGRADFTMGDDAFAYAFTDYADSWTPPVVLNLEGKGFADVSRRPAFRPLFESDMARARQGCVAPQPGRSPNGACAAYAADAARLGRFDAAWRDVRAHYDRSLDPDGYPRCTAAYADGHCPPGREIRYRNYPAALRAFLIRTGYIGR